MLAFAPSPEDIAGVICLFLVFPIICVVGAILLRRRPFWCLGWLFLFAAFYGYLLREGHPATSSKRADVTLVFQDLQGRPVANAAIDVTQYPLRDGPFSLSRVRDEQLTTDTSGRVTIVTTSTRRVVATFRVPGYRWGSIELDVAWEPTFHTGQFGYSWAVLPKNEKAYRSTSTGMGHQLHREHPLTIPIVLPSTTDEDSTIQARMRELLPNDA